MILFLAARRCEISYASSAGLENEFIEARRAVEENLRFGAERLAGVGGLGEILLGQLPYAVAAIDIHEDVDHERDESLVGADVGGRLLAADVLLAGGEREYEAALAVAVGGLSDEAAGNLADELLARGDDSGVGAAVAERNAEGLGFQRDDIGLRRWTHDAERERLGDGDDQQRALGVDHIGDGGDVLDGSEEVGRLDQHAGGLGGDGGVEGGEIDAPVAGEGEPR